MEIRIATSLVDTLCYRLIAQATMAAQGEVQIDVVPLVGGDRGKPASARRRRRHAAEAAIATPAALIATPASTSAELSAAVRALRERTYREVLSQVEHFNRTTGRDWQIRRLDYRELQPGAGERAASDAAQLTLVTHVELGACVRTLH
jgi:hypothetical protein